MNAPISVSKDVYVPSPWGSKFHSLRVDEALGAGAAGPGKSIVLLMDPFQQILTEHARCLDDPKADDRSRWLRATYPLDWGMSVGHALHLRRTMPMLKETITRSKRWFRRIDPGARYNENESTWTFSSGYRYQFGHCKDPDDWQQYYGAEPTWVGFDELVQFMQEQYEHITGRVRCDDPVLSKMLRRVSMSNPAMDSQGMDGIKRGDPNWVRKLFVDPEPMGDTVLERPVTLSDGTADVWTSIYLRARLQDNPNPEFVKQYSRTLAKLPKHMRSALEDGNWYINAGSYFGGAWDESLHVVKPFRIPDDWKIFRSMDWGFKAPGCVHWWAMDEDGNLYCIREMTFRGKSATQVAKAIQDVEKSMGVWHKKRSGIAGVADTQLWEKRGDGAGLSKADEMVREGVLWEQADKKSRQTNAERIYSMLEDHENRTTTPSLVFFDTCTRIIQTLPGIQTDKDDPSVPMDGGDDHWYDSCAYACARASMGRGGIPSVRRSKTTNEWSDDDDDEKEEPQVDRGRIGYGWH